MILNVNIFCKKPIAAASLLLLFGIAVYVNTFSVPFVSDDQLWITSNDVIRHLEYFFKNSIAYNTTPSRFIALLTIALNYHFGGLDVFGYHLVNLAIHLFTTLLVYMLLRLTFQTPYFLKNVPVSETLRGNGTRYDVNPGDDRLQPLFKPSCFIPLLAALLFAVHPVQTQAVTYTIQRMTSLATLFYLLSMVLYVKARLILETSGVRSKKLSSLLTPYSLLFCSVLAAVLAMKTKEIAFTLPFAAVLYEIFFFKGSWKRRLLYLLPLLATLPIIPLTVIDFAGPGKDMAVDVGSQLRAGGSTSRLDYLFTQFRVIVTYLRLLVLPINQNLDYDYPVYTNFFTPPVFLSFLLLSGIFVFALYLFRRTRWTGPSQTEKITAMDNTLENVHRSQPHISFPATCLRLISFGILWFFLTIAMESSIIPILDVIAEHRLYLPDFGAATAFATIFYLLGSKITRTVTGNLFIIAVAALVILLGYATFQRNQVWGSAIRLWEDTVEKSPDKARPYNNLGGALNEAGRPWDAIPVLYRALEIAPYFDRANFNLGRSYLLIGQSAAAIPLYQKAIRLNPRFAHAYNDLSAALIKVGKYAEAAALLEQNLDRLDEVAEAHFNLGVAYINTGKTEAARRELAILTGLDPALASQLAGLLTQ